MGRALHEVFRIREVRDHRTGGTVVALNPPDTGSNRDPEIAFYDWYSRYQEGGIEALVDGNRDRGGSGTRSLTRSKRRSSIWPLRSRTCRRVSSPSTSPTHRAALCQKPPFIGS